MFTTRRDTNATLQVPCQETVFHTASTPLLTWTLQALYRDRCRPVSPSASSQQNPSVKIGWYSDSSQRCKSRSDVNGPHRIL